MKKYLYGNLSVYQVKRTFEMLHGDIYKLLIYKDETFKTKPFENNKDYEKFFTKLLYRLGSLNVIFKYPVSMLKVITLLQACLIEARKDNFNYILYRSMILDAQNCLDMVKSEVI